ncbi:MAG: helix-turn-helix transcriptional regulator [Clostridiales bacterium]|nr:helix-turn-helix transcriptional regulator [Clostridiales bacterium]
MKKNMFDFSERLKGLRNNMGITQSDLAKRLSLTRASVNAWEMGLSVPSTPVIVELAMLFNVSTDYLLGLDSNITISTDSLTEKEIAVIMNMIDCLKDAKKACR